MMLKTKTLLIGAGALALAACGEAPATWNQPAGSFLDEGGFGNPTMQNTLAQLCVGKAKGYVVPDPVVALHPSSTADNPVYYRGQVRCSGNLNGKYAEVLFTEYVDGATTIPTLSGGGLAQIEATGG